MVRLTADLRPHRRGGIRGHPRRRPETALGLLAGHPRLARRPAAGGRTPPRPVSPIRRSGAPHRPHALANQGALTGSDRRAGRTRCRHTPSRYPPLRAPRRSFRRAVAPPFRPAPGGPPRLPTLPTKHGAHPGAGSRSPACQGRVLRRGVESLAPGRSVHTGETHAHLRERRGLRIPVFECGLGLRHACG